MALPGSGKLVSMPVAWLSWSGGLFAAVSTGDEIWVPLIGIMGGLALGIASIWGRIKSNELKFYHEQAADLMKELADTRAAMSQMRHEYDSALSELAVVKARLAALEAVKNPS